MEQHPVPQHIASYEFRLVGDMTIRQFVQLAAGVGVALIFYATPLPAYFKWPLIFFSGFLGFAFAFMPIEERPLSQWVVAFFKAIFSPTLYTWKKKTTVLDFFRLKGIGLTPGKMAAPIPSPDKKQLGEYLATLPAAKTEDDWGTKEEQFMKQIASLFQGATLPATTSLPLREPAVSGQPLPPFPSPAPPKQAVVEAKLSTQLPIPAPPTRPNILVGMVTDKKGEIIEGAILEIRNSQKIPVRALRTNRLGQFQIATALENDAYEIEVEKEGFQFDIIKIEAKGEIIKPIEIKAK